VSIENANRAKSTFCAASASSIKKLHLASAPSILKPAVVDSLLDDLPVHVLVDLALPKILLT